MHGQEVSELDYCMYQEDIRIKGSKKLSDLTTNVSDHYPVLLGINIDIEHTSVIREEAASKRIAWDLNELENVITKTHSVLRDSVSRAP